MYIYMASCNCLHDVTAVILAEALSRAESAHPGLDYTFCVVAAEIAMFKVFCVMDSVGKTAGKGSSRQYWSETVSVLKGVNIELHVRFQQGAGLQTLVRVAMEEPHLSSFDLLLVLSL